MKDSDEPIQKSGGFTSNETAMDDSPGNEHREEVKMEIRPPNSEVRVKFIARSLDIARSATRMARQDRSAELYSAVSQICNLRLVASKQVAGVVERFAECNSAIQQINNLRYFAAGWRHALLHFQSSGVAQSRAFTGLFNT
jgi:hypothetical protein